MFKKYYSVAKPQILRTVMERHERPYRTALTVPGRYMRCVQEGLNSGSFDELTRQIWIESNWSVYDWLVKNWDSLDVLSPPQIIRSRLSKVNLASALCGRYLDFAFFDLACNLNAELSLWHYRSANMGLIADGARLAATADARGRSDQFGPTFIRLAKRHEPQLYEKARDSLGKCLTTTHGERPFQSAFLFTCAFWAYDLRLEDCWTYAGESAALTTYVFVNRGRTLGRSAQLRRSLYERAISSYGRLLAKDDRPNCKPARLQLAAH